MLLGRIEEAPGNPKESSSLLLAALNLQQLSHDVALQLIKRLLHHHCESLQGARFVAYTSIQKGFLGHIYPKVCTTPAQRYILFKLQGCTMQ